MRYCKSTQMEPCVSKLALSLTQSISVKSSHTLKHWTPFMDHSWGRVQYVTFQEKTMRLNHDESVTSLAYLSRLFKHVTLVTLPSTHKFQSYSAIYNLFHDLLTSTYICTYPSKHSQLTKMAGVCLVSRFQKSPTRYLVLPSQQLPCLFSIGY